MVFASPRWLQPVLIGANEAAFDRGVLLGLTWDGVQDGLIVVKGGRAKTGARQRVGIAPALRVVLDELRAEYRRTPNTKPRVFTKAGKPIPLEPCGTPSRMRRERPRSRISSSGIFATAPGRDGRRRVYHSRWPRLASVTSCAGLPVGTSTFRMTRSAMPSKNIPSCSQENQSAVGGSE